MSTSTTDEDISQQLAHATATGRRRALQWLRLRLLSDQAGAERLQQAIDGDDGWLSVACALDLLIAQCATSMALLRIRPDRQLLAAVLDRRQRRRETPVGATDWRASAHEAVPLVEGLTAQHIPDPTRRLDFYEQQARAAYDASETP